MWDVWFEHVAIALLPFITAAGTWAISHGAVYLKNLASHTKNKTLRELELFGINQLSSLMDKAVIDANQVTVNTLKAAGTFDKAAALAVKKNVMNKVMSLISGATKEYVDKYVPNLETLLSTLLEASVATAPNKVANKTAVPTK